MASLGKAAARARARAGTKVAGAVTGASSYQGRIARRKRALAVVRLQRQVRVAILLLW